MAKKAELKTKVAEVSVDDFLASIESEQQRADSREIAKMMSQATKCEPRMWGTGIIGFGDIHLKYDSGRELDWFIIGFSPRKANISLYVLCGLNSERELLKKLGKHTTGKGCLYIKTLADVDAKVLQQLIEGSVKQGTTE